MRRFLFIVFLFLPGVGYALLHANEPIHSSLEVSFDIQPSRIKGRTGESLDDVKIDLLFRNQGQKVKVRILRKGFFGSREMDFEVLLQ